MTTYAEYLESVKRQEARDRDRFMGHDSHESEPLYSAETGREKNDWLGRGPLRRADWHRVWAPDGLTSFNYLVTADGRITQWQSLSDWDIFE